MQKGLVGNVSEARQFLRENPVRIIVAPDGGLMLMDGHHTSTALYRRQTVFKDYPTDDPAAMLALELNAEVACNWRGAFADDYMFWSLMGERQYAQIGNSSTDRSVLDAAKLPVSLRTLIDDPWRALAGIAVKVGGVIDFSCVPFFQFNW